MAYVGAISCPSWAPSSSKEVFYHYNELWNCHVPLYCQSFPCMSVASWCPNCRYTICARLHREDCLPFVALPSPCQVLPKYLQGMKHNLVGNSNSHCHGTSWLCGFAPHPKWRCQRVHPLTREILRLYCLLKPGPQVENAHTLCYQV